jgi:hypothetical protein
VAVDAFPATPAPIEAFRRNAELRLAALLVALVVVPLALDHAGNRTAPRRRPGPSQGTVRKTVRGRHVRPPRSC